MPMIDVWAAAGTFPDRHRLAQDLAAAVMRWEQVPDLKLFRNNTAAFVHDLPAESIDNVAGESNYLRVQVLTPVGVLDREKQLGVVKTEGRMGNDVIIGYDGKPRCTWAGAGDTPGGRYHDEVWGTRTYDESALFEALTLGVFQAGLSWSVVFNKRDGFRKAFHDFDVAQVAALTDRDIGRLVQDASIIRNRAKIQATVENARAMSTASPSLAVLAKSYQRTRKRAPRSLADLPTSTPEAEKLAKQLKSQGYRFVGPTSVYAFMQNVGVVNDHIHGCFRATDYTQPQTN